MMINLKKVFMENLKYSNIVLVNLIIASIIPLLIWGPFFPDLIVSISALFFLYYTKKNNDFYYFNNKPFVIFLSFCIISTLISLQAENIYLSVKSSLFYFRIGVFSCFIWYLIDKDKSFLTYFYYALILSFSALVIGGYFEYFIGDLRLRNSSFFRDEQIMGSYLSRLFPLLFGLFLVKEKKKLEIYFIGFLFILVDILIYISGERTAFFYLNLSTVFIIILIKEYQRFRLITFIIALIGITLISLNSPQLSDRMFQNPFENMGFSKNSKEHVKDSTKDFVKNFNIHNLIRTWLNNEEPTIYIFTPHHDSHIRTAYNMFKDKPIIGHGPKMFREICKNKKYATGIMPCSTHPHNFYVQLLAETGIVGFLFLFSAMSYVVYASLRQFKSIIFRQKRFLTDYQVCLLAGILISIWPFSPNGNFFNNWLIIVYGLPVGFYLQSIYSKKVETINGI
jgi:O-antigen ligase